MGKHLTETLGRDLYQYLRLEVDLIINNRTAKAAGMSGKFDPNQPSAILAHLNRKSPRQVLPMTGKAA
jgi:hypothetical protein